MKKGIFLAAVMLTTSCTHQQPRHERVSIQSYARNIDSNNSPSSAYAHFDLEGHRYYQDGLTAGPGSTIEYLAVYSNNSGIRLSNVKTEVPIPEGVRFLPGSIRHSDIPSVSKPRTEINDGDGATLIGNKICVSLGEGANDRSGTCEEAHGGTVEAGKMEVVIYRAILE